jgi:hypothetical protein
MQSKAFLIAIAAFALTTTSAYAYGGQKLLERAGFSETQISAFEEARELRQQGKPKRARDLLVEAGVDEATLQALQATARNTRHELYRIIEQGDYETFLELVDGTPLADIVITEADFALFQSVHAKQQQKRADNPQAEYRQKFARWSESAKRPDWLTELSDEQLEALRVARQANDRATARAILSEAGM